MRGRYIVALGVTAAVAVGGTTVAVGQGTGGTLGPKAQGTQTFQVRIKERNVGFNCGRQALRRCARRPGLGSLTSGSGTVFQGDQRVGTAHFSSVLTQRGRNGGELFFASLILNDGSVNVQGAQAGGGNATLPNAITGGTGAYAGARGVETETEGSGAPRGEFRVNITLTFIP
jgi:hypothetical protein